jgi:hypothetical protein
MRNQEIFFYGGKDLCPSRISRSNPEKVAPKSPMVYRNHWVSSYKGYGVQPMGVGFIVISTKIEKLKFPHIKKFLDFQCLIFICNDYNIVRKGVGLSLWGVGFNKECIPFWFFAIILVQGWHKWKHNLNGIDSSYHKVSL